MNFDKLRRRLEELEQKDTKARFLVTLADGARVTMTALDFWLYLIKEAADAAPAIIDAELVAGSLADDPRDPLQARIREVCGILRW